MPIKLTDEQIEQTAREAMKTALGTPESDIGAARLRNLEFYNAEATGELAPPEVDDRSDFVATDVADTIDGMLPQIMRMFVGSDDAVSFESQGQPGSEQEAKLATAYVNHLFYTRNDGTGVVYDWFKDALTQKVGFVKVWVEEQADDAKQKYEGQTPDQLAMLLQDGWTLDEETAEQDEQGLLTFTVRKESRSKQVRVMAVPPGEMRVDVNARWGDEPAMIGQSFYRRRFELEQDGYDLTDVSGTGAGPMDVDRLAQLGEGDDATYSAPHESHELLRYEECYIKLDVDGDGVTEWTKVCLIEDKLAVYEDGGSAIEQVDDHPYVWICPVPRPHSFFGDCPADRLIQVQKLRTHTIRSIQDNMFLSNNQRTYVNTNASVNIDDVLDSRPGGVIRGQGPASDAITPIQTPAFGAPAYQFNEYVGSWGENRSGFNRYSAGTDQNALNKTARGTELLTAKADMRMELMARFFGVGMRQLFAKMLKLAIQHQNVQEMVQINGRFVPINPSEFRNQYHVKINVGLGNGSKEQQMARIMAVAQMIGSLGMQAGVVRPQHISELIRLAIEANDFKNPERFVDAEPTGMPPTPQAYMAEKQQVEQHVGQLNEQMQQLAQENQGLKAEKAAKEGDLMLNHRKLDIEERKLDQAGMETAANLSLQERAADRSDAESRMKGAETAQRMHQADEGDSAVKELQEQVAALTDVVQQIVKALQPQEQA